MKMFKLVDTDVQLVALGLVKESDVLRVVVLRRDQY